MWILSEMIEDGIVQAKGNGGRVCQRQKIEFLLPLQPFTV